jgi:hypothetical protein
MTTYAGCCIETFASMAQFHNPLPVVEHAKLITPRVVCANSVRISRFSNKARVVIGSSDGSGMAML